MNALHSLDDQLFLTLNDWARSTPALHPVLAAYGAYGVVVFGLLLVVGVLRARRQGSASLAAAGWACLAVLLALAVNQPIGHLVAEARPYLTHPGVFVLADRTTDYAFPSDHAVMAGATAAGLWRVWRRLGLVTLAAALAMAFTRVYIGAHYPWDVVAGLALGALVSLAGWAALREPLTRATHWLRARPGLRAAFAAPTPAA